MEKSNAKQPEVIEAADFDPKRYAGRDVVFVKVPAEDKSFGREIAFFGVRLRASIDHHPALVGTAASGLLGWQLLTTRDHVAKMLMTDDAFAKSFRGGAFHDIHERYVSEFSRYYGREPTILQWVTDPINRLRLQWRVGNEVIARGVGVAEAIAQWRWGQWLSAAGALGAIVYSAIEWRSFAHSNAAPAAKAQAMPDPILGEDAPKDWQGKVYGTLRQLTK